MQLWPDCLQAWSGVRACHAEGVVEHGDDVRVGVVLVEADVAFELAELEYGAVGEPGCPIDGRADAVAGCVVRAQHMGGEADRARGAEAAAAVEGGERPSLPVEGDGAQRSGRTISVQAIARISTASGASGLGMARIASSKMATVMECAAL